MRRKTLKRKTKRRINRKIKTFKRKKRGYFKGGKMEPPTNYDNKALLDPSVEDLRIQQDRQDRQDRQRRLLIRENEILFRPINENEEHRRTPVDYLLDYDRNTPNST